MARPWNWQKWGGPSDLIHQSDIGKVIGKFGCPSQFLRSKEEAATGKRIYVNAGGKLAAGNAVHGVIHRVLQSPPARALVLDPAAGELTMDSLEKAFDDEFAKAVGGRAVDWYKIDGPKWRADCLAMLRGLLRDMHQHVGEVVLTEAAFVYQISGIWMTGAIDLIYRARLSDGTVSDRLSFADWKTGKQRPNQIELDHGWQSGIYGNALKSAWFVPYKSVDPVDGEEHRDTVEAICVQVAEAQSDVDKYGDDTDADGHPSTDSHEANAALAALVEQYDLRRFDEYPERIRYVHLQDLIPYTRKQKKELARPEELHWQGLTEPDTVQFEKGDSRGPAWYHVNRSETDTPRLRHLLKSIVGWVRFGRFPAAPGDVCNRCKFKGPCLTDGYKPIGEEKKRLSQVQTMLDGFDGFDDDDD